jgi:hypothetical protein
MIRSGRTGKGSGPAIAQATCTWKVGQLDNMRNGPPLPERAQTGRDCGRVPFHYVEARLHRRRLGSFNGSFPQSKSVQR